MVCGIPPEPNTHMSKKRKQRQPPGSVAELALNLDAEMASPRDRLLQTARFVRDTKAHELTVNDVLQFLPTGQDKLSILLFAEHLSKAVFGTEFSSFAENLHFLYAEKRFVGLVQSKKLKIFLKKELDKVSESQGEDLSMSQLCSLVDNALKNEDAVVSLFKALSSQLSSRLVLTLTNLDEEVRHPCCRGNAVITADELEPLFRPLLNSKNPRNVDLELMLPVLQKLHECSGVYCSSSQKHCASWLRFENEVFLPFLARNPAINAWMDPVCLLIVRNGPPPAEVTTGIAALAERETGLNARRIAGPTVFSAAGPNSTFNPTPVLFSCTDSEEADLSALLLRHGGLPGPNNTEGAPSFQIARFSTNNFTFY